MLAVVKAHHIEVRANPIPKELLAFLRKNYGEVNIIEECGYDDDLIEVKETAWYQAISKKTSPGETIKLYREMRGWTQAHLGELLGGVSRQNVHNLEAGRRTISKDMAKKLAAVFEISVERFI